jgi:PAS domain S-box-containing protein
VAKRRNGEQFPVEILLAPLRLSSRLLLVSVARDISERKRAEQALLDLNQSLERRVAERTSELSTSEARFRAMIEHAPEAIVVYSVDTGRFLFGNQHACDLYGVPMSKLPELTPLDVSPEFQPSGRRTADLTREKTEEVMAGGMAVFEWTHRQPNGRLIPTEVRLLRLPAEGQNLIRASIIDNSDRKRAEHALRESEARFSAAFHASPALIGILRSSDGKYVLANDAHLSWLGYPREDVVGRTCLELGMWENPSERDILLNDIQTQGSIRQRECRWRNRHGEQFTVLLSAETITLDNTPHILLMALDISKRKQAEIELRNSEARLRESEARFNIAFQASPIFINILRMSDQKYVWANDAFVNRLGYSLEEVIGRSSAEFGMWMNPAERDQAWIDMRTVGSIRQRECRWLNRHGEPFTILLSSEIIKFNNAPHILSLALDITQRKRAEEELLKALEREKQLSQLKSNFVSMVSHEFRTPLGIIQSSTELLRDFFQRMQPAEREEQLESIIRNTRRMAGMMEEVLVLSRLDAGKLDFNPTALDVGAFCHRVVDEVLSTTHHRCPVNLVIKPLASDARADERLLGHIFTNLLSNAVKYSEPGTTVRFVLEQNRMNLVGTILDEGVGISEEDQEKLFTAFHRGSNVGTRPGTGLGLVLVKRCAELHGGKVQISSALGKGTSVVVALPVFGATV